MAEDIRTSQIEQDASLKPRRKRNRKVFSCSECSRRKQKCDRSFPCSNCIVRNKQSACHYETKSAKKQHLLEQNADTANDGGSSGPTKIELESIAQVSAFGFAKPNGSYNTTLGIFSKIWSHETDVRPPLSSSTLTAMDNSGTRERYKNLVRRLPSKPIVKDLVQIFFQEVNHQYYPLDEAIFRDHLEDWNNLSFPALKNAPMELSGDMQFFPALLLQCLALALQFLPLEHNSSLESLKYVGMSFDDVASDYSQSGVSILSLLGKRNATLITVQAGFLRTAFLRNYGMSIESWHSLSQTIRDAQEIGLQRTTVECGKPMEKAEKVLEIRWLEQLRRRVWLILSWWDIDLAMLLGRPTTIDHRRDGKPPFPIDTPIPQNRREVAPAPRTESDPPTPLSTLLWTSELFAPMWDIYLLENEDPNRTNLSKVEQMHELIKQISLYCPPCFRPHNPDTRFDEQCHWLPQARYNLQSNAAFTIMALHRPYIFTSSSSRTLALKAGLEILDAQRNLFEFLALTRCKMFCLVLRTFDAIILITAIYVLYPLENRDVLNDSLQHFEWATERFHVMGEQNSMAKAALGVLKATHVRLEQVLSTSGSTSSEEGCMSIPPNFDFSSIAPPQPIDDLLRNHLYTGEISLANIGEAGLFKLNATAGTEMEQFDDFRSGFWGSIDDYNS